METTIAQIDKRLDDLFRGARGFKEVTPNIIREDDTYVSKASIRVSKKQLWFFAFKAKEVTGVGFECEHGADYPTRFLVGHWDEGSEVWAECTKNNVDGPYWIRYSTTLITPEPKKQRTTNQ